MPQPSRKVAGQDPDRYVAKMVVQSARDLRKAQQRGVPVDLSEIGTTGLRQYGGYVVEEWLRSLSGRKAAQAYREMMDNSPIVGAILFAIEWLARGVEWRVEPGNSTADAEFVEECMGDMSHTWADFISEALSCLGYGWADHEIVYKRRSGLQVPRVAPETDSGQAGSTADTEEDDQNVASSKYSDGKVGWRKLPIRAQETLLRWHFDGYSGIQAMEQIDWHGGDHVIGIEKSLLFRCRARRNNPEGYSILRTAYVPYFRLKNIETIEAIGIERDLAGLPKISPPDGVDLSQPQNAELLQMAQDLVTSVRRDEFEGLVMPQAGWLFELVSSAGSRQIDTDAIVRRYEQRIATSMLADFILVGQDSVGSFAMVDVKADLFGMAIDGILDMLCDVLNRYAIPRLLTINGKDTSEPPEIRHGSAGRVDLQKVGEFLAAMNLAGAPIPWSEELVKELFSEAGLPANFEEQTDIVEDPLESPALVARLAALEAAHAAATPAPPATAGSEGAGVPAAGPGKQPVPPQLAAGAEKMKQLTKAETSTGAMVALYPSAAVAKKLALPGGESASALHLTLAYLGDAAKVKDPEQLRQAIAGFAATTPRLQGTVSGTGNFSAGPEPVTYASADVPGLPEHRQRLVDALQRAGAPASSEHGYTPHVTLAYDKRSPEVANHALNFTHVVLKLGAKKHRFALSGNAPTG